MKGAYLSSDSEQLKVATEGGERSVPRHSVRHIVTKRQGTGRAPYIGMAVAAAIIAPAAVVADVAVGYKALAVLLYAGVGAAVGLGVSGLTSRRVIYEAPRRPPT